MFDSLRRLRVVAFRLIDQILSCHPDPAMRERDLFLFVFNKKQPMSRDALPRILDRSSPSIFFKNRPEFRYIQLTAWKIDALGLFRPEFIYLIDPPELKPVGFVCLGCPPPAEILRRPGPPV
jgi:hypothetical protein